jgi:hypothetical protein
MARVEEDDDEAGLVADAMEGSMGARVDSGVVKSVQAEVEIEVEVKDEMQPLSREGSTFCMPHTGRFEVGVKSIQ